MSKSRSRIEEGEWTKVDLHIHTLDDPKDIIDYSAQQLLERARELGFGVLAITLHDAVFDRAEVFEEARKMGILLIRAAEMRIEGADIILLNISAQEAAELKTFADVRALRARRGESLFTIAPHPFYVLGGSIGSRLLAEQDCFDAIELCHFHKGPFNPNRRAARVARRFGKPLIATSDAHRLHAFGRHYTRIRRPPSLTCESFFATLRAGPLDLTSPPCTAKDLMNAIYFIFLSHPARLRRQRRRRRASSPEDEPVSLAGLNSPGKRDTATPDENPHFCSASAGHRADRVQIHLESR
jgi:predicted metal-dependent phosphoesterase TrpH